MNIHVAHFKVIFIYENHETKYNEVNNILLPSITFSSASAHAMFRENS